MAKKGRTYGKQHYNLKYRNAFRDLMNGKQVNVEMVQETRPATFLGFKLKNVNELWRWDTLENIS